MAISEFELFHGVVLTKLLRSKRPISLHMIEARPGERWSAYTVNGEVDLFIKHSTTPRATVRGGEGRSWPFVFGLRQLRQMAESKARGGVYVALVGASRQVKDSQRCICLLTPEEVKELVDCSLRSQQSVTVRLIPGKSLRVYRGRRAKFKVPQSRLDKWEVPGS
jgi:hypothetical protein